MQADRFKHQALQEALALVRKGAGLWLLTAHQRGDMDKIKFKKGGHNAPLPS